VKHWKKVVLGLIFLLPVISVFNQDIKTSLTTRFQQFELQKDFIKPSLFGYGIGTYRLTYDVSVEEWWNKEPIHFVPIIVLSEFGVVLFLLVIVSIFKYILNVPRETLPKLTPPALFVLFMISVDHYAWDIYQGQIFLVFTAWLITNIDKN
jgi:O-antigen ligase